MRAPTDLPRRRRGSTSRRVALVVIGVALFFLVISLRGIAGFYTDYLWFDEIGLTGVWKGVLGAKIGLAIVFSLVFFAIVWANLAIADVLAPTFRPMGPEEQFIERYHEVVGARAGMVRIGVAVLFALVAGPGAASQWQAWLLFRNQRSFGTSDALFKRDIGFYVFELPFVKFVADWLFAAVVIVLIVTAVAHYLNGGIRFQTPMQKVTPQVKAHLSVLLAALALLKAGGYFLQRYELVYSSRGVVDGAGYTDVKAQLPALNLLVLISLFACALFLVNILRRGWVLPVIAVGVWALISVVIGAAYPAAVQKFRVQPTESTKERPYILRNITATRDAYNLRNTEVRDFEASTTLTAADLEQNQATIRNIRLWDPLIVRESYKRLQEIRNFYQINDVDVDRYPIDGVDTQALVSVRELNVAGIPSQSWVNQHLVYTHGYGAVLTPSTGVAPDSNPDFRLKDLPPVGEPGLRQPAIYYGQGVDGYAIVKTKQQEIDYTDADGANHTTVYSGDGGVRMNSFVRRAALALRFGDMNPLISSLVTSESRAIYVRNIDERVRKAAPFLRFDSDPYPVLLDGQVKWIYDAYTTTSRYPYSQRADTSRLPTRSDLDGAGFNYVRNSVKVVIDAYNGKMTFYIVDPDDPIVKAYAEAFPGMFTDGDLVEPELRAHFRYPEDIFRVQTNMFGLYHIDDPANFYNRTDAWEIAQQPGVTGTVTPGGVAATTPGGAPAVAREARMEPYHLLMRLPGRGGGGLPDPAAVRPLLPRRQPQGPHRVHGGQERPVQLRPAGGVRHAPLPADRRSRHRQRPHQPATGDLPADHPAEHGRLRRQAREPAGDPHQPVADLHPAAVRAGRGYACAPAEEGDRGRRRPGGHARLAAGGVDGAVRIVAAHARAPGGGGAHRPARHRRRRDPARHRHPARGRPPPSPASSSRPTAASPPPTRPSGRATWASTSRSWTRPRPWCARPPTPPRPRLHRPLPRPPRRPEPPPSGNLGSPPRGGAVW